MGFSRNPNSKSESVTDEPTPHRSQLRDSLVDGVLYLAPPLFSAALGALAGKGLASVLESKGSNVNSRFAAAACAVIGLVAGVAIISNISAEAQEDAMRRSWEDYILPTSS